jgi:hypothetical protein
VEALLKDLIDRKDIRACGGPIIFIREKLSDLYDRTRREPGRILVSPEMMDALNIDYGEKTDGRRLRRGLMIESQPQLRLYGVYVEMVESMRGCAILYRHGRTDKWFHL